MIHVGYVQFDKELLMLAFPAERLVGRNKEGWEDMKREGERERERERDQLSLRLSSLWQSVPIRS